MNDPHLKLPGAGVEPVTKFADPDVTADGAERACVSLNSLQTLWFNTGTLCNIECANCYIESGPKNDRLSYIATEDVEHFLDEIAALELPVREIGFTGGEPFMNPEILTMAGEALRRGFEVLILTNAMQPMMRPRVRQGLIDLNRDYGGRLTLRVSLDHHGKVLHEKERGQGTWDIAIAGIDWLVENGFSIAIAGRTCWGEAMEDERAGYAALFAERGWPLDADNQADLMLFPEMDVRADVPEITTACWAILGLDPAGIMCASSRMVVKRKGASRPVVLPCTLLPYLEAFEMGATLSDSMQADGGMFREGAVKLAHPHCAKFCVLGGGSCSAT